MSEKPGKSYLIDTSVILDDVENLTHIYQQGENKIFISDIVLSELNKKKELSSDTGFFAREFFRLINNDEGEEVALSEITTQNGPTQDQKESIAKAHDHIRRLYLKKQGVKIPIHIIHRESYNTRNLEHGLNDARIAEIAKDYALTLLTNDIALKVYSLSLGIHTQSLMRDSVENPDEIDFHHTFCLHRNSSFDALNDDTRFRALSEWSTIEILEEDNTDSSSYMTGKKHFGLKINGKFEEQQLDVILQESNPYVKPINLEQKLYYAMLIHPQNRITIATGSTGSGKTLIALQAGIHLVKKGIVDGIIYMRNTVTANDKEAELGFRKGDESQKLGYFMYPLFSAINFTIEKLQKESLAKRIEYRGEVNSTEKQQATEYFLQKHNIEVIDIAHARGITIARKFVIFDEVQNASNATVKLIGTRMGEESRIVFLGDWAQIDHPYLSKFRNGAISLLKKALRDDFIAGIQLHQTIRSEIAGWFQQNF
ncbi:MAG: PhoH family protein [Wolinella sp.]